MLFALLLRQASGAEPTETAFDRMPTWGKYGILALLLLFAVVMIEAVRRHGLRDREVKLAALGAGFRYSDTDPAGIGELRFVAFGHAKGTRINNVVSGNASTGAVVRSFDFSCYIEHAASESQSDSEFVDRLWGMDGWGESNSYTRTTKRYSKTRSGALVKLDAFLPSMMIAPSNLITRAFEMVGAEDIDFESEEFNRGYDVRCLDKRFASLFLDAQMIDFILGFDRHFAFETFGNYVLCHGKMCEPRQLPSLAAKMGELLPLVNQLVYDEYPTVAGVEYREAINDWNRRPGGARGYY
ncbi:MAG: hypothetical protein ABIQ73_27860 [Acidimicrobiales bacterium]